MQRLKHSLVMMLAVTGFPLGHSAGFCYANNLSVRTDSTNTPYSLMNNSPVAVKESKPVSTLIKGKIVDAKVENSLSGHGSHLKKTNNFSPSRD